MSKDTGTRFLKESTPKAMDKTAQQKGEVQPPLEREVLGERIILPDVKDYKGKNTLLIEAIKTRVSHRRYNKESLSLDEISYLLYATQGVKEQGEKFTKRTVPSAGARHALDTYLLINRVDALEPGLYRYMALEHALVRTNLENGIADNVQEACLNQAMITTSAVTFIWAADTKRMTYRYGERGYRYLFLDAGHVCQNLYLAAELMNCGVVAIAAYDDDLLNETLHFDGEHTFALYLASLGKID